MLPCKPEVDHGKLVANFGERVCARNLALRSPQFVEFAGTAERLFDLSLDDPTSKEPYNVP